MSAPTCSSTSAMRLTIASSRPVSSSAAELQAPHVRRGEGDEALERQQVGVAVGDQTRATQDERDLGALRAAGVGAARAPWRSGTASPLPRTGGCEVSISRISSRVGTSIPSACSTRCSSSPWVRAGRATRPRRGAARPDRLLAALESLRARYEDTQHREVPAAGLRRGPSVAVLGGREVVDQLDELGLAAGLGRRRWSTCR